MITPGGRRRLREAFALSGVGLHTGRPVEARVLPATAGAGRRFVRVDLPGRPEIVACVAAVRPSQLSTSLASGDAVVQTVEHLLAALGALGVADARIEIDGPELPILDGSALPWAEAIVRVSDLSELQERAARSEEVALEAPIVVRAGDAFVEASPAADLRFSYRIVFPRPIGAACFAFAPGRDDFAVEVAPARSFVMLGDLDRLRDAGLIQGGSLANALVCGPEGWLNPPLRFADEPVRHKLLDLIGDLSLLGEIPRAHYVAFRAGHRLHVALAREIAARVGDHLRRGDK